MTTATAPSIAAHRVFYGAAAALMLHVVDDNFVQPPDGTSAADHLVSGLVPLALLGLATWAYPRVRTGAAAVVALVVGVFGLAFGLIEAGYYTLEVGPSGDDYSGFLAGAAGFVLIGLGFLRLWQSRRSGGHWLRRYGRRTLRVVGAVVVANFVVLPVAFAYLVTHVAVATVPAPHLGAAYEDVSVTTSDGLDLAGWYVPSKNGAAVIAFHGRTKAQPHARMLARHGYGVLVLDRRGVGESEGDGNMLGWGGTPDIHAAVDFLKARPDVDPARIGGIGFSVGGEEMLQAAAENPDLAAVVSEGAGTRQTVEQHDELSPAEFWINSPSLVVRDLAHAVFTNHLPPPTLMSLAPKIAPRPALLIWAPNGGNMETMTPVYADLIGPSAEVWEMPDAMHMAGLQAHPKEYERRVVGFFDRSLPAG
jgi:hypothetical protein